MSNAPSGSNKNKDKDKETLYMSLLVITTLISTIAEQVTRSAHAHLLTSGHLVLNFEGSRERKISVCSCYVYGVLSWCTTYVEFTPFIQCQLMSFMQPNYADMIGNWKHARHWSQSDKTLLSKNRWLHLYKGKHKFNLSESIIWSNNFYLFIQIFNYL
jgi:hypothetical protein